MTETKTETKKKTHDEKPATSYIAVHSLRCGSGQEITEFEPGENVSGLSAVEMKRLIRLGAVKEQR